MKNATQRWHRRKLCCPLIIFCSLIMFAWFILPAVALAENRPCPEPRILGREELVIVATRDGGTEQVVVAKIDTGAKYSSIDIGLARDLGLNVDHAETVQMKSALGDERRPLTEIRLIIAGKRMETVATVTDRSALSTVVLVGQTDLDGFLVDSSARRLTVPTMVPASGTSNRPVDTSCGAARAGRRTNQQQTDLSKISQPADRMLLTMLPFALVVVVFFRVLIGIRTFGLFGPVLIALAFVESGPIIGFSIVGLVLVTGLLANSLLHRLKLARVPRLALLVTVVVCTLLAAQTGLHRLPIIETWSVSMPVVVAALVIEQFWAKWERTGLADAVKTAVWTGVVTAVTWALLSMPLIVAAAGRAPVILTFAAGGSCIILGRYRGLRLVELWRFRSLMQREGGESSVPSRMQP